MSVHSTTSLMIARPFMSDGRPNLLGLLFVTRCGLALLGLFVGGTPCLADTYHVNVDGVDQADRDGKTPETAWKSLAFACDQIPEGKHTIELGPGVFLAKRTAQPPSGTSIVGQGSHGEGHTSIIADQAWPLSDDPNRGDDVPEDECLIFWRNVENVAIRDVELASSPTHRITAAIAARGVKGGELANLNVHDFRWAGLHLTRSERLNVHDNTIVNASTEKHRWHNGQIRTRWIKHSEIFRNTIRSTEGGGYGYKAGGHERVRIHHNFIDVNGEFSIESAHELEFGVEIDHNYLTGCISVPKSTQSTDPNERECEYTFWIHDNLLTDSYTVEGPRNHLRISHNYIRIEHPNGRVYTHHGGVNRGPIWIHNNVIENVDRAFVWMNEGLAENIYVFHNTVLCADAGDRAGTLFGAYTAERLNNWVVKNNLFIAPESQPRQFAPEERGVHKKIDATNNVFVNVKAKGGKNKSVADTELGLQGNGGKPWPFFSPDASAKLLVDKGVDIGLPFEGKAPDIGAYEAGVEPVVLKLEVLESLRQVPMPATANGPERRELVSVIGIQKTVADQSEPAPSVAGGEVASNVGPAAPSTNSSSSGGMDTSAPLSSPGQSMQSEVSPYGSELVEVDWLEEAREGGITMYVLGALSIFLLAAIGERLIMLRRTRITPPGLVSEVLPLFAAKKFDEILDRCKRSRSALGDTIFYLVKHRKAEPRMLSAGASDLGARAIGDEEQRLSSLAVVAGVAPLLGLLGTMIGMIESFKLVEVFGDEGGASLLAGSISKALITTATGLVLAIPALFAHFAFKIRTHRIAQELELQTERVFNAWFLEDALPEDEDGENDNSDLSSQSVAQGQDVEE